MTRLAQQLLAADQTFSNPQMIGIIVQPISERTAVYVIDF